MFLRKDTNNFFRLVEKKLQQQQQHLQQHATTTTTKTATTVTGSNLGSLYASTMLRVSPVAATNPVIPAFTGKRLSGFDLFSTGGTKS